MARSQGRVPRLYCNQRLTAGTEIGLERDASHYLVTVLRLAAGAEVRLFNATDGEWASIVVKADRKCAVLRCETCLREAQPPPDLDYLFAPLKAARIDYLAQKATEMGVRRLKPVMTANTAMSRVNVARLRANVIEAAEQCNMVFVPEVAEPEPLAAVIERWDIGRALIFCDECAGKANPLDVLRGMHAGPIAVLVGPEGGFSSAEREMVRAMTASVAISLGPRIMRADTAAVAVLALVQSVLGDWR